MCLSYHPVLDSSTQHSLLGFTLTACRPTCLQPFEAKAEAERERLGLKSKKKGGDGDGIKRPLSAYMCFWCVVRDHLRG